MVDFSGILTHWYEQNKRELPWRETTNPYHIWLSEIILQQTRVDQGLSYYLKFIYNYPTIIDLANANQEEILKLWQGLGYYSRARNLHKTAQLIRDEYRGVFPNKFEQVKKLNGVGDYTAAAILSFSYNQPYAVIDGNVYRVLSRIFGIKEFIDSTKGKNTFKILAEQLLDKKNPSTYNQAIMEFGAIQCKPKLPLCDNCCFLHKCFAYAHQKVNELPRKEKQIKQRNRYFNYLVLTNGKEIVLNKRTQNDIWNSLFDFPLIETSKSEENITDFLPKEYSNLLKNKPSISKSNEYIHQLSHQKIHATFWLFKTKNLKSTNINQHIVRVRTLKDYPVPKLIEKYMESLLQNMYF